MAVKAKKNYFFPLNGMAFNTPPPAPLLNGTAIKEEKNAASLSLLRKLNRFEEGMVAAFI